MEVEGNVSSFEIVLSNNAIEVGVASASYYLDTAHQLLGVVFHSESGEEEGEGKKRVVADGGAGADTGFHRYVSRPDLSEGRLSEVARGIATPSTRISKQSVQRGEEDTE